MEAIEGNSRVVKNVLNGSSCTERPLSTSFSDRFVILTIDSQELTIHGLDGGLNFDLTPLLVKKVLILAWFRSLNNMENSILTLLKCVPLPVQIVSRCPLLTYHEPSWSQKEAACA